MALHTHSLVISKITKIVRNVRSFFVLCRQYYRQYYMVIINANYNENNKIYYIHFLLKKNKSIIMKIRNYKWSGELWIIGILFICKRLNESLVI